MAALLAAVVLAGQCVGQQPPAAPGGAAVFTVARVVDGDTVELTDDRMVRLLEIDTPETHHPSEPVECYGPEASARTAELLPPGETVRLVYEQDREDRYGRTLAHVYRVRDGLWVNAELVRGGYAEVKVYSPNNLYEGLLRMIEGQARAEGAGMWGACPLT